VNKAPFHPVFSGWKGAFVLPLAKIVVLSFSWMIYGDKMIESIFTP
jgi:hypothetical protein